MNEPVKPKVIGRLLSRARREAHVQQSQMAAALKMGVRTMSRWEAGEGGPGGWQCEVLAALLKDASGETWRALVQACGLSLEAILEKVPEQRAKLPPPPPPEPVVAPAPPEPPPPVVTPSVPDAVIVVEPPRPPERLPEPPAADPQDALDDLLLACAEELDVGPRRLRMAFALLLAEAGAHGLTCDDARGLLLRRRRRLR